MRNKPKMTKDTIPENFTLSLALVDALPVLIFGGSMILTGLLFGSPLFLIGAALCFWAGAAKLDPADVRSNWIEQLTNAAAQAAIFTGILFLF